MLIGKIRMVYLLTAMLAVGAGAGYASHEDAVLHAQAEEIQAEETAMDSEELEQTDPANSDYMGKEYDRQKQAEEDLTETLEEKEGSGADTEEINELKSQIRNVQLQQQILKARMEAQG